MVTDIPIDGWTNGWTLLIFYTEAIDASGNADFPTDLAIYKSITNKPANGPTDQRTDIHSYRDAIAANNRAV